MSDFDDIIPEFVAESAELLETVESGLLQLESGDVEHEAIHTIFRAIHSIKGGAGFVGLSKIERLAHRMEDVLNLIRNGDLEPTPAITDALLQALDVLTALFNRLDEHETIDVEGPIRALDTALHSTLEDGSVKDDVNSISSPASETGMPEFEISEYNLKSRLSQGNVFYLNMDMAKIEERGLTPLQLVNEMLSMGEILDSMAALSEAGDSETYEVSRVAFHVLYFTVLEEDLLMTALHLKEDEFRRVGLEDFNLSQPKEEAPKQEQQKSAPAPAQAADTASEPEPKPAPVPAQKAQPPVPAQKAQPPAKAPQPRSIDSPPPETGEYLTFTLGDEEYGVDILSVQEIIGLPEVARLPRSPEYVLGVMNLRGMVVPVMDLRKKLGLPVDAEQEPVVVVVRVSDKIMGAVVDGVNDVIELKTSQIQEPPDFVGVVRKEFLRGLTRHQDEMVILLDMVSLMAPETLSNVA